MTKLERNLTNKHIAGFSITDYCEVIQPDDPGQQSLLS